MIIYEVHPEDDRRKGEDPCGFIDKHGIVNVRFFWKIFDVVPKWFHCVYIYIHMRTNGE